MSRQYAIEEVIGRGGFGTVYRARLSTNGFVKDVAIKLLNDANPGDDLLARFRDEARILALLRDRAIVSVEPPVKLNGRWALVMDYVPGESVSSLLRRHGPLPERIALEIISEVSRVLVHSWSAKGPDGRALHVVHRDVKPENIHITPTGDVKLLDFGTARADFDGRETNSTISVSGTRGFIAPERFAGRDGESTDVFSLGMTLHKMLTNTLPKRGRLAGDTLIRDPGIELALSMTMVEDAQRPTPTAVLETSRALLESAAPGPSLEDWAPENVRPKGRHRPDELVGTTLSERAHEARRGAPLAVLGGAVLGGSAVAVTALLLAAGVLLIAGVWMMQAAPPEERVTVTSAPRLPDAAEPKAAAPTPPAMIESPPPPEDQPAVPHRVTLPKASVDAGSAVDEGEQPDEPEGSADEETAESEAPLGPEGTYRVEGVDTVTLQAKDGTLYAPGDALPPGKYAVLMGGDGAGRVTKRPGAPLVLRCNAIMRICKPD